jgi:exodeoxyribonuclease-3
MSQPLLVASWNVNSVNARVERLLAFLDRTKPDVLCLQELKCVDEKFPYDAVKAAGYHAVVHGQKTYNGVAVLSRAEPEPLGAGFRDGAGEADSRLVGARVRGVNVFSAYIPNGQSVGAPKYAYKLEWLRRLRGFLDARHNPDERLVLAGDFNVAPTELDVRKPEAWRGQVLFSEPEQAGLKHVCDFGLFDTFRLHHDDGGHYSWWDYRQLSFPRNDGLRIDFIFATPPLAKLCDKAWIDRDERKGDKPSDHAPCFAQFVLD